MLRPDAKQPACYSARCTQPYTAPLGKNTENSFPGLIKTGSAAVRKIITPDTLELDNGRIIKLAGLYFPDETPQETGPYALLAIKVLKDMLTGKTVEIYQTPKKDWGRENRMGHQIAHLLRVNKNKTTDAEKPLWVQGTLLELGLAIAETTQRNPQMATQMYQREEKAKDEKIGLWENPLILSPEDAQKHIGSFQIVQGRIESVSLNKNILYINFGKNWRDDFTVSLGPALQRQLGERGLNPLQWGGESIRVRGWLEEYNGPHIKLDNIEAIEFLDKNGKPASTALPEGQNAPMFKHIQ